MPEIQCRTCKNRCGMLIHSQYNLNFITSWAKDMPLPKCDHYEESTYHGLDGVYP